MGKKAYCCVCCGVGYNDLCKHFLAHPECVPDEQHGYDTLSDDDCALVDDDDFAIDAFADDELAASVAWDLATMRYQLGFDPADIAEVKRAAGAWVDDYASGASRKLRPLLRPGVDQKIVNEIFSPNLFAGIETEKKEIAHMKKMLPFLEPRVVSLGVGADVASYSMIDLLERRLQNDKSFRKTVVASSDRWKTGDRYQVKPDKLLDITDGVTARWHPHLLRPARPVETCDLRVGILFNCDDIEVTAPTRNATLASSHFSAHLHAGVQRAGCGEGQAQTVRMSGCMH